MSQKTVVKAAVAPAAAPAQNVAKPRYIYETPMGRVIGGAVYMIEKYRRISRSGSFNPQNPYAEKNKNDAEIAANTLASWRSMVNPQSAYVTSGWISEADAAHIRAMFDNIESYNEQRRLKRAEEAGFAAPSPAPALPTSDDSVPF